MRESELGDALRAIEPQPEITDEDRLTRIRSVRGRVWAPVAKIGAMVAAAVVVGAIAVTSQQITFGRNPAGPAEPIASPPAATLPTGTLECAMEGSYAPPALGQVTPNPLGASLCQLTSEGFEQDEVFEGDLTTLVDVINSLPDAKTDFSHCKGSRMSYFLVLGFADGHTEVVNGMVGGECDLVVVNQKDKTGATPVLEEFTRLVESDG